MCMCENTITAIQLIIPVATLCPGVAAVFLRHAFSVAFTIQ